MKKNFYLLMPAAALVLTGCSSKIKLTSDNFAVTPTPLEYVAGDVPATISVNVPSKVMKKKATVECIPVLKWNGGSAASESFTIQGEKVEANNTVISYKNGGSASMRFNVPFQEGMEKSDLYMQFNAKKGKKTINVPEVKIGYGTQCTAALITRAAQTANFAVAPDQYQRVISQKQEAAIKFLIGQANLRGSELNSQNVKEFIETLKNIKSDEESLVLKNVEVSAYASPDGAYSVNERLADKRGQVSEGYVNKQLKKAKLSTNVDTKFTAEDWEGFQQLVSASNLQDKQVILSVLSMYSDPEEREREIRNISVVYKELAQAVLPELRRARMTINYDVVGRSDEQIIEQFGSDASQLSVEELVYAANKVASNPSQKEAILKKTTQLFPKDARAYNNLAVLAMQKGDNATAQNYLRQALSAGTSAESNINLGLMAIQNGQFAEAEQLIGKGATAAAYDEALGNLYVAQGKYGQAANKFAGAQASNSAVLANILAQNYADAQKVLGAIKTPDAVTYYLKAVLAARMNNASDVKSNIAKVAELDSKLAERAANDIEFANFK